MFVSSKPTRQSTRSTPPIARNTAGTPPASSIAFSPRKRERRRSSSCHVLERRQFGSRDGSFVIIPGGQGLGLVRCTEVLRMAERKPAKKATKKSAKRIASGKTSKGFTAEERAAMKER